MISEIDWAAIIRESAVAFVAIYGAFAGYRGKKEAEKLTPKVEDNSRRINHVEGKTDRAIGWIRKGGSMTGISPPEEDGKADPPEP